jgi:N,N'-diacetyllegionaminate synthase
MDKVIIIAEAGVNHNGDIDRAFEMIVAAKKCGADFIKFQTFQANLLASPDAKQANYQLKNAAEKNQFEMLQKLELDENAHQLLISECKKQKIGFLSSPFDLESIALLSRFDLEYYKIPSGEITNFPYLREIAKLKKQTILSTGMADFNEVSEAINILFKFGLNKESLTLLQCTTEYPCPFEDVNLNAMLTLHKHFGLPVGYSDHTSGIEVSIAAVALGACIIEKHFTLNKNLPGPDHKASLDPDELKSMVVAIRNIELSLGDGVKKPSLSELQNLIPARKSIFLKNAIKKGELIKESDMIALRPGDGISAIYWDDVIGKKALKDLTIGHKVQNSDFE